MKILKKIFKKLASWKKGFTDCSNILFLRSRTYIRLVHMLYIIDEKNYLNYFSFFILKWVRVLVKSNNFYRYLLILLDFYSFFQQGHDNMRVPPVGYDSSADSVSQPSLFVIYKDAQAYPEYIITYEAVPNSFRN